MWCVGDGCFVLGGDVTPYRAGKGVVAASGDGVKGWPCMGGEGRIYFYAVGLGRSRGYDSFDHCFE